MASILLAEVTGHEYAFLYKTTTTTPIALNADVPFDGAGPFSAAFSQPSATTLGVLEPGIYKLSFSAAGTQPNQFALTLNGVVVASTRYGSGAGTQQNSGQIVLALSAGDQITLRNSGSTAAVTLATGVGGTQPNVMASLLVETAGDEYAYVYTATGTSSSVAANSDIVFVSTGATSSGLTHAPSSTVVRVGFAGTYIVTYSTSTTEPCQLALYVDGTAVPSALYGSGAGTQQNGGQVIVSLTAGQQLTLHNMLTTALTFLSTAGGSLANVQASMLVELVPCFPPYIPPPITGAPTPSPTPRPTPAPTPRATTVAPTTTTTHAPTTTTHAPTTTTHAPTTSVTTAPHTTAPPTTAAPTTTHIPPPTTSHHPTTPPHRPCGRCNLICNSQRGHIQDDVCFWLILAFGVAIIVTIALLAALTSCCGFMLIDDCHVHDDTHDHPHKHEECDDDDEEEETERTPLVSKAQSTLLYDAHTRQRLRAGVI